MGLGGALGPADVVLAGDEGTASPPPPGVPGFVAVHHFDHALDALAPVPAFDARAGGRGGGQGGAAVEFT